MLLGCPGREVRVAVLTHALREREQLRAFLRRLGRRERLRAAARQQLLARLLRGLKLWRVRIAPGYLDAPPALAELRLDAMLLHAIDELDESAAPPLGSAEVLGEGPPDDVVVVAGPRLATLGLFEPPQPAAARASIAATTPNRRCPRVTIAPLPMKRTALRGL